MKIVWALALMLLAFPASARKDVDPLEKSFQRIDAMIERGEYARARDALDEVISELKIDDPRVVRYHERFGASWLREGKVSEAHASFTSALKAAQRLKVFGEPYAKANTGMGLCLRRENNDKYALRFFRRALSAGLDEGTKMFVEDQIREINGSPPVPAR